MTKIKSTFSPMLFAMTLAIVFFICSKSNVYASGVPVYLDGNLLTYTEAQPQIINDRTMVPLTETANHFGMTSEWDKDTGIMVFTKGNRRMEHEIYSNYIYINGVGVEYDVTSTIINDRTVMPVIMLADALGAEVQWDRVNARVLITSPIETPVNNNNNNNNNNTNTNNNSNSNAVPQASLYSMRIPDNTIEYGESVKIIVETNFATTKVRISDDEGVKLIEATDYYDSSDSRIFEINYTPDYVGNYSIKASAGNDAGYAMGNKTGSFYVNTQNKVEIEKVTPSSPKVDRDENINLTVRTSTDAVKVEIVDEDGKLVKSSKSPATKSSNYYSWELRFSISKKGSYEYIIKAYDDNGKSTEVAYKITVGGGSSNKYSEAEINNIYTDKDEYEYGETAKIEVYTNNDTVKVYIEDEDGYNIASTTKYTKDGSRYVWELKFRVNSYKGNSKFYVYALDSDDEYVSDSFSIYVDN